MGFVGPAPPGLVREVELDVDILRELLRGIMARRRR